MIADFDSNNAVLIHYRGGAYGNFLLHVVGNYISNTVKVNNNNFSFSTTGNAHATVNYISKYLLTDEIDKKIKSYNTYKYVPTVTNEHAWQQMQDGKKFLVLCDTAIIDNYRHLLSIWPNCVMIRSFMPMFVDKLVGYANLMQKAGGSPVCVYKNSLFDQRTIEEFRSAGSDLDQTIVDATVRLFQQDFGIYGKTFSKPGEDQRIFNFNIKNLNQWETFKTSVEDIAKFLHGEIVDYPGLETLYRDFYIKQSNLKYYNFTKDSTADQDDLIGRALIKFYQQ